MKDNYRQRTLEVHAGEFPDPVTGARATPIYHTSSYAFESAEKAKKIYWFIRSYKPFCFIG